MALFRGSISLSMDTRPSEPLEHRFPELFGVKIHKAGSQYRVSALFIWDKNYKGWVAR